MAAADGMLPGMQQLMPLLREIATEIRCRQRWCREISLSASRSARMASCSWSSRRYGAGPRRSISPRASACTPRSRSSRTRRPASGQRMARKPARRSSGIGSTWASDGETSSASNSRRSSAHLPPADLPQAVRRQPLLLVESEHGGGPVVGRRIVGGAREGRGAFAIRNAAARVLERVERREPAGEHGAHAGARRHAQERVALAELAILVAASGHEGVVEPVRQQIERHDVEVMIRIDEQARAVPAARARRRRRGRGRSQPIRTAPTTPSRTRCVRRSPPPGARPACRPAARPPSTIASPVLGKPIDLAADRVELAVGRDDTRALQERQGGEPARDELVRVLAERDVLRLVAEQSGEAGLHLRRLRGRLAATCRPRTRRHRATRAAAPRSRRPAMPDASVRSTAAARRRGSGSSVRRARSDSRQPQSSQSAERQ